MTKLLASSTSSNEFRVKSLLRSLNAHVYISSNPAIKDNDEFSAQQIEVSRLKKPNGAAFYLLPTQNPDDVSSMLIWCKQFKEYIGSADFKPAK
jgi:hypothetical protein